MNQNPSMGVDAHPHFCPDLHLEATIDFFISSLMSGLVWCCMVYLYEKNVIMSTGVQHSISLLFVFFNLGENIYISELMQ